jgi:hypothetical protein
MLSEGDERPEPVSELASPLFLGDGHLKSRALGNGGVAQVLAQSPQGVNCMQYAMGQRIAN